MTCWSVRFAAHIPAEGLTVDKLQPLRDIDLEFRTYRDFWKKYVLGDLTVPSCLGCGQATQEFKIVHLELHGVGLCGRCTDAIRSQSNTRAEPGK